MPQSPDQAKLSHDIVQAESVRALDTTGTAVGGRVLLRASMNASSIASGND